MKRINMILVFLISSLALTGISFIDGKMWDLIFLVIGMIAYSIVGILFSIGLLGGKQAGAKAYAFVFFLLMLIGFKVYEWLEELKLWILSWPIAVKIIVPAIIILSIVGLTIFIIVKRRKKHKLSNRDKK